MSVKISAFLFLSLQFVGVSSECQSCTGFVGQGTSGYRDIYYRLSNEKLENPRRGFMLMSSCGQNYACGTLDAWYLNSQRQTHGITVIGRQYVLHSFKASPISAAFLDQMRTEMLNVRAAGFTLVPRFTYTTTSGDYDDAAIAWAVSHTNQLSTLLHEFEDIIDVVQGGMIGTWGEWYYSTNYGIPSTSNPDYGLTATQWAHRSQLFLALLNAAPPAMQVQIRTPNYKMQILGDSATTTWADIQSGNNKGRTAHHNDCFLADATDVGTYRNVTSEYPYLAEETKHLAMGGETCPPTGNRHDCTTALSELKKFHWSYINKAWYGPVYTQWETEQCFEQIHRDLGYRLALIRTDFPEVASGRFCFSFVIRNLGFAAPYRIFDVHLVLKSTSSGLYFAAKQADIDVRQWLPGQDYSVSGGVEIPTSIPAGDYQVFMTLSVPQLANKADYFILLANVGVPVNQAGLNDLGHTITIQGNSGHTADPSCPSLSAWTPPTSTSNTRLFGPADNVGTPSMISHVCKSVTVPNYSFESNSYWVQFGASGFQYVTSTAYEGQRSAKITNGGCKQVFTFNTGVKKLVFSGYSKNVGVSGVQPSTYSLYCDIQHRDNTWTYGQTEPFDQGSVGEIWHRKLLYISTTKDILKAFCYGMYRDQSQGTAYFDNFQMWELNGSAAFSDCAL